MATTPDTIEELLGADLIEAIERLDIHSSKVFAGRLPGERRSKRRGQSVEFDDYRPYVPGDDLRHIDWNVYARSERFFLKLFREEEDLSVDIVVDASASMRLGEPMKLLFATRLAVALAYIGLCRQNRVSCAVVGGSFEDFDGPIRRTAPRRGRRSVKPVCDFLLDALHQSSRDVEPRPGPSFHDVCRRLALGRSGRGVMVLISDFMFREGYLPGLNYLAGNVSAGGFDTYAMQVLSPLELDPGREGSQMVGDLRLLDAEGGPAAEVTLTAPLIRRYRQRLEGFIEGLSHACRAREIDHLLVPSDEPIGPLLMGRLRREGLVR